MKRIKNPVSAMYKEGIKQCTKQLTIHKLKKKMILTPKYYIHCRVDEV